MSDLPIGLGAEIGGGIAGLIADLVTSGATTDEIHRYLTEIKNTNAPEFKNLSDKDISDATNYLGDYKAQLQTDSGLNSYSDDPATRAAQMKTLAGLQDASVGGMSEAGRQQLAQINQRANNQAQAQRDALAQQAASRGQMGSGNMMAQQMLANQGAANNAYSQGLGVAANDEDIRMKALEQMGALGGSIRGQDFSQAAQKASAQDAINRFNTANSNEAQLRNLNMQQNLAQQNFNNKNNAYGMSNRNAQDTYQNAMQKNQLIHEGTQRSIDQPFDAFRRAGAVVGRIGSTLAAGGF